MPPGCECQAAGCGEVRFCQLCDNAADSAGLDCLFDGPQCIYLLTCIYAQYRRFEAGDCELTGCQQVTMIEDDRLLQDPGNRAGFCLGSSKNETCNGCHIPKMALADFMNPLYPKL